MMGHSGSRGGSELAVGNGADWARRERCAQHERRLEWGFLRLVR